MSAGRIVEIVQKELKETAVPVINSLVRSKAEAPKRFLAQVSCKLKTGHGGRNKRKFSPRSCAGPVSLALSGPATSFVQLCKQQENFLRGFSNSIGWIRCI